MLVVLDTLRLAVAGLTRIMVAQEQAAMAAVEMALGQLLELLLQQTQVLAAAVDLVVVQAQRVL
jgi:hypothetical protein